MTIDDLAEESEQKEVLKKIKYNDPLIPTVTTFTTSMTVGLLTNDIGYLAFSGVIAGFLTFYISEKIHSWWIRRPYKRF